MPRKSVRALNWTVRPLAAAAASSTRRAAYVARMRAPARRGLPSIAEWKAKDSAVTPDCNTTPVFTLLNGIARGDDINERTGRQIRMKSILVNANVTVTASTGIDQTARVIIFYDRQTNAAAPSGGVTDVLLANDVSSVSNLENRNRFQILYDRKFLLNASGEPGSTRAIKWYRKLNLPVTFNAGDAATVADITTGSLYMLTLGSIASGNTDAGLFGYVRVRYEDA